LNIKPGLDDPMSGFKKLKGAYSGHIYTSSAERLLIKKDGLKEPLHSK